MNGEMIFFEASVISIVLTCAIMLFYRGTISGEFGKVWAVALISVIASFADILGVIYPSNFLVFIYLSSFGFLGYFWLLFCFDKFGIKSRALKIGSLAPALLLSVLTIISAKTGWIYSVSGGARVRGELFPLMIIAYFYLFLPILVALLTKKKYERDEKENLKLSLFAFPTLVGVLDVFVLDGGVATVPFAVILTIIMVLGNTQHKRIVTDNLTRLPNRYALDEEIEKQLRQYRRNENDSFYVIVCDMDNFKTINDSWGHKEGDRALELIADALTLTAQKFDSEVFRIGGDEFVIITDTSEAGLADDVCRAVEKALDGIKFRRDFDIEMSMGSALYTGNGTISELIDSADKKLYRVKKTKKGKV